MTAKKFYAVVFASIFLHSQALSLFSSASQRDLKAHMRAKIASSVAKGERRERERSATSRPVCHRCSRPDTVCVCSELPSEKFTARTKILILQHPNERRKKNLSTVPLLRLSLKNVEVVGGYIFEPESLPQVQESLEQGRKPLLLNPSEDAISLDDGVNGNEEKQPSDFRRIFMNDDNLLIIVDGTWTEAKRMVRDSPRLVECCQPVQFTTEASSIYDALRREPRSHCLSTLEACAQALVLLEPDTAEVHESLHRVLQAHVDAHLENARIMAPRHVGASKHKLYDKNKRRREIESVLFENRSDCMIEHEMNQRANQVAS